MKQDLAERVTRLERENRRLKRMAMGAGLIIAVVFVAGQAAPERVPKEIRAETFRLVDEEGKTRGSWTQDEDGQELSLRGPDLMGGITLRVSHDKDMSFQFHDKKGHTRAALGLSEDKSKETAYLILRGRNEKGEIMLGASRVGKSHAVSITFLDTAGRVRGSLGTSELPNGGHCNLFLADEKQKQRIRIGYDEENGKAGMSLLQGDGAVVWSAP